MHKGAIRLNKNTQMCVLKAWDKFSCKYKIPNRYAEDILLYHLRRVPLPPNKVVNTYIACVFTNVSLLFIYKCQPPVNTNIDQPSHIP